MRMFCVIGGSGFIGTRLCRLLDERGVDFVIVDKARSQSFPERCVVADIRDSAALSAAIPEGAVIIHLAAEHRDDVTPRSLYRDVNVAGTVNVCQAARARGVTQILFTSSVAVYGFAPVGTGEEGRIAPFNDYGATKYEAEEVLRAWQTEAAPERALTIIRPTVVFGENNRGNVYNLLRQIASGRFLMIGSGENRKSMAYVGNLVAFLTHMVDAEPGARVYNFVDEPAFTMTELVNRARRTLGVGDRAPGRIPYWAGLAIGKGFDLAARMTGRKLPISSIRVKKFCSNSVYRTAIGETGFVPPFTLEAALERTVRHEFVERHEGVQLFYSE